MTDSTFSPANVAGNDTHEFTDEEYLSKAPVNKALLHLCLPMMAAMTMGTVYAVINAWFIGRSHDANLLAAVMFATPIPALIMALGGVFGVGGSTLVTRLLGESRRADATRVTSFVFWGSLATGAITAVVSLLLLHPIVDGLGADASSHHPTAVFAGILMAFSPVLMAAFALEQVVRAEGASRTAMLGLIYSTIVNLALDVVLILWMHMGVTGAALAIGLSNVVTVAYFAIWLQRNSKVASLNPRLARISSSSLRSILVIGSSELMQSGFLLVSSLVLNHVAIRYGDEAVASFGVASRITQIPEFLAMGISMGAIPLLAYSFGAKNFSRLNLALKRCIQGAVAVVIPLVTIAYLFRSQLLHSFGGGALGNVGVKILTAMLIAAVFAALSSLATSYFQATDRGAQAGVMSMIGGLLFLPIALIAPEFVGINGIIWAMPIAETVAAVVGLILIAQTVMSSRRHNDDTPQTAEVMA